MKKIKQKITKIRDNNISVYLTEMSMTQRELSKKCGVSQSHLSEIITKKRKGITLIIAAKIARGLKQPIEKIFSF